MATITEDYVSFETAKLLKEKGFDEACNRVYQGPNLKYTTMPISPLMPLGELGGFHPKQLYVNNNELGDIIYTAPTLQMAMKWLREVHNLFIQICIIPHTTITMEQKYYFFTIHKDRRTLAFRKDFPSEYYFTYEEACEAATKYCLENLI